MYIKQSYLTQLKSTALPRKMLFFDTETKPVTKDNIILHKMYLAQCYYTERTKSNHELRGKWTAYNSSEKLSEYIESKAHEASTLYLFAHNIFFDLQASGFFEYFTARNWELDFYYEKGLVYILNLRKGKQKICALSTTNFFDFSLAKIGKIVNLPKLKIDFDKSSKKSIEIYCRRDVEIMVEAMKLYFQFIVKHNCGRFGLTKASQAMNLFRHRFLNCQIGIHENEEIINLERKAYIGGRTEAFRIAKLPKSKYVSLDINSMYPFIMQKYKLPIKLLDYYDNPDIIRINELLKSRSLIIKCQIKTDEPAYAIRYRNRIIFPVGTFSAYLSTPEIKYAIKNNHLLSVSKVAIYEQDYIFKDYIDTLYPLKTMYKKEDNEIFTKIVKIMLNSLYGKFGQRRVTSETHIDLSDSPYSRMESFDLVTGKHWIETHFMNKIYVETGDEITKTTLTAIPAHITAYARLLLWKIIKQVGYENVLYCDTDSIKIKRNKVYKIKYPIHPYNIGALDIEEHFNNFTINGAKDYKTEHTEKIKGIPSNAVKIADNKYKYTRFFKQSTHLRREIINGVIISEVEKTLYRNYTKGKVDKYGIIHPFNIPNDITLPEE